MPPAFNLSHDQTLQFKFFVTLRVTNPFVMKMIQTQLILMNLLTWCHLTSTVFVHQTVDTSAHTNYLISLVKEQFACDQAKTDNYDIAPDRCQQTSTYFTLLTTSRTRVYTRVSFPCQLKEAGILRPLYWTSSRIFNPDFQPIFWVKLAARNLFYQPSLASEGRIIHAESRWSILYLKR
jgi:hypothetical protein